VISQARQGFEAEVYMWEVWIREFQGSFAASPGQRTVNAICSQLTIYVARGSTCLAFMTEPASTARIGDDMQMLGTAAT
jgi:hypothetical protein